MRTLGKELSHLLYFAIWSMVHTTTQHILSQLVFDRDAILNINHEANWHLIKYCKHTLIYKGN